MASKRKPLQTVQIHDGKWYRVAHGRPPYYLECCGCSLVHKIDHKVENGVIWERLIVDDEMTAEARRLKSSDTT